MFSRGGLQQHCANRTADGDDDKVGGTKGRGSAADRLRCNGAGRCCRGCLETGARRSSAGRKVAAGLVGGVSGRQDALQRHRLRQSLGRRAGRGARWGLCGNHQRQQDSRGDSWEMHVEKGNRDIRG